MEDALVVADDEVMARLWPRLGPRVRKAYLGDRNTWIALRREVDAGATLPAATLARQHQVFAGWARAFRAAARARPPAPAVRPVARRAASMRPRPPAPSATISMPAAPPALAKATTSSTVAGAAVAGGLALARLIVLAARRRRS